MKETRLLMGMPITVEIVDKNITTEVIDAVYAYFATIDERFSTYKDTSEVSRMNNGLLRPAEYSADLRTILALGDETAAATQGYFSIWQHGTCDPSGIVKGWAINQVAHQLNEAGFKNYYIDAGGDIQISGLLDGQPWHIGIRNPFNRYENVKILAVTDLGIATSGTAIRGQHIFNPHQPSTEISDIVSMTVVGPNIYEADRFATAAFAMGRRSIYFIEQLAGFEGYMIDAQAQATYTTGFERLVLHT